MSRRIQHKLMDQYQRVQVFLSTSAGAGTFLLIAAAAAIVCANSALAPAYDGFLHAKIGITVGNFELVESVSHWINDGLMAIFFLLVGLEIKREMLTGELSSPSQAMLPAFAAVGGMLVPAAIFATLNHGDSIAMRGWAVPVATDIAFSLGVLALLGSRVPLSLKVFLTAVAVIDDLGAIAIIALFYSEGLQLNLLGIGLVLVIVMLGLNFLGIKTRLPYLAVGTLLWLCLLKSGLHATIAGVLTALCIPHGTATAGTKTPLIRLENDLHAPVIYIIMPLFAFANAGVSLSGMSLGTLLGAPLPAGITLGLLLGKPIGICGAVWLAVRLGISTLPRASNWYLMLGISLLCGIGFTVSLFIGNLGFEQSAPELINMVKAGVLVGSMLAGVIGFFVMRYALLSREAA